MLHAAHGIVFAQDHDVLQGIAAKSYSDEGLPMTCSKVMKNKARRPWVVFLKFGLSAAALVLLFRFVKIGEVGNALRSAAPAGLLLGAILNVATRVAAAGRTYAVSRVAGLPVSFSQTLQALFISNFWSLALPGVSAGSVATVWRYHGNGAGVMQSVAVLSASRMVELVAFCLLALLGLATSVSAASGSRLWVATLLAGIILAVMLGLWLMHRLPMPRAMTMPAGVPAGNVLQRTRAALVAAVQLLRDLPRRALLQASGWALLQGVLDAATVLALALALGIPIGLPQALWINALSYLAILLPISAAGLGMRELAVLAALLPLGISRADALALALLMLAMLLLNALAGAVLQLCTRAPARQPA